MFFDAKIVHQFIKIELRRLNYEVNKKDNCCCYGFNDDTIYRSINGKCSNCTFENRTKSATSSTVYGYNKVFWGNNESHSAYSVHFIAKYKMGGVWYTDKSKSIKKGKSCPSTNTSALSVERDWHLKLNPDGGGKYGCEAWGYIYND